VFPSIAYCFSPSTPLKRICSAPRFMCASRNLVPHGDYVLCELPVVTGRNRSGPFVFTDVVMPQPGLRLAGFLPRNIPARCASILQAQCANPSLSWTVYKQLCFGPCHRIGDFTDPWQLYLVCVRTFFKFTSTLACSGIARWNASRRRIF